MRAKIVDQLNGLQRALGLLVWAAMMSDGQPVKVQSCRLHRRSDVDSTLLPRI